MRFAACAANDTISNVGIMTWFVEFDNIDVGKNWSLKNCSNVCNSSGDQEKLDCCCCCCCWEDESDNDAKWTRYVAVLWSNTNAICNDTFSNLYGSCSPGGVRV